MFGRIILVLCFFYISDGTAQKWNNSPNENRMPKLFTKTPASEFVPEKDILDLTGQEDKDEITHKQNRVINNYVRFKRDTSEQNVKFTKPTDIDKNEPKENNVMQSEDSKRVESNETNNKGIGVDNANHTYQRDQFENNGIQNNTQRIKRGHDEHASRTPRMLMESEDTLETSPREPRGPVSTQWVKNQYPIDTTNGSSRQQSSSSSNSDGVSSSSNTFRAPRVHFVTQRRSESTSPAVIRPYEREGRVRDMNRAWYKSHYISQGWRDNNQYIPSPMPSHYRRSEQRYDPYYRNENFDRYDRFDSRGYAPPPRFLQPRSYYDRYDSDSRNSQYNNRIIYWTTLPEVTRRSQSSAYRDEIPYRPYPSDTFPYRKPYFDRKGAYEQDRERSKVPYPMKVSTNVNVEDTKKYPELRIYSNTDRSRYAYKGLNYQSEVPYRNQYL